MLDLGGRSGPAALDDEGAGRVQGTDAQADQDCSETCLVTQGSVDERRPARYVGHEFRLDAHAGEGDGSRFGAALADAVPVPVNRHTGCCLGIRLRRRPSRKSSAPAAGSNGWVPSLR